ncbi:hypothetical protein GOODEAATRI_034316 [Goodea atripinnis]|uniref:Secreted protein n=1 Tax=Goodea atripinnis TaxID=208336 RepID=A0ABV0P9Z9_9TELE
MICVFHIAVLLQIYCSKLSIFFFYQDGMLLFLVACSSCKNSECLDKCLASSAKPQQALERQDMNAPSKERHETKQKTHKTCLKSQNTHHHPSWNILPPWPSQVSSPSHSSPVCSRKRVHLVKPL